MPPNAEDLPGAHVHRVGSGKYQLWKPAAPAHRPPSHYRGTESCRLCNHSLRKLNSGKRAEGCRPEGLEAIADAKPAHRSHAAVGRRPISIASTTMSKLSEGKGVEIP